MFWRENIWREKIWRETFGAKTIGGKTFGGKTFGAKTFGALFTTFLGLDLTTFFSVNILVTVSILFSN
jgi:hypothetical protein